MFITMRPDHSAIKSTSAALTEPQLREFFRPDGKPELTQAQIDSYIERARKHEV